MIFFSLARDINEISDVHTYKVLFKKEEESIAGNQSGSFLFSYLTTFSFNSNETKKWAINVGKKTVVT